MAYNTYNKRSGQVNMSFPKLVWQCILRTLITAFIGLIIYMSIVSVVNGMNYKIIGYEVFYSEDGESFEKVYEYRYTGKEDADWVDKNLEQYMDEDGYYKENYYKQDIPSSLDASTMSALAWIAQIPTFIIWGALIYTLTWNTGNGAADKNEFGGAYLDKLRGMKAALIAVIPYVISYLLLVVAKIFGTFNWAISVFKILNYHCFAFNDMIITGGLNSISVAELICLAVVLLPLPLFATFGYAMGVRHTNIKEKIVYKD